MKEPNSSFPHQVEPHRRVDYYDSLCWVWPTCVPVYLGKKVFNCLLGLGINIWYMWLVAGGPSVQVNKEIITINLVCHGASLYKPLLTSIGNQHPLHQKFNPSICKDIHFWLVRGRTAHVAVSVWIAAWRCSILWSSSSPDLRYRAACEIVACLRILHPCVNGCYKAGVSPRFCSSTSSAVSSYSGY